MLRFLGRLLAVFAMLASAINAQCAWSCSLSGAPQRPEAAHDCCTEHKAPAQRQGSCSHVAPRVMDLGLAGSAHQLPVPDLGAARLIHAKLSFDFAAEASRFISLVDPPPSPLFVLRV